MQLLHSRCFYQAGAGAHIVVPGIDCANHSFSPNAQVGIQHSLFDALADEVDPRFAGTGGSASSIFTLTAEQAIAPGEEITIRYGRWPSEPFFQLFGFVPDGANPFDAVSLFASLGDMVAAHGALLAARGGPAFGPKDLERVAAAVDAKIVEEAEAGGPFMATMEGLDHRLAPAARAVAAAFQAAAGPEELPRVLMGDLVTARCRALLEELGVGGGGDAGGVERMHSGRGGRGSGGATPGGLMVSLEEIDGEEVTSANGQMALKYRRAKGAIVHRVLAAM